MIKTYSLLSTVFFTVLFSGSILGQQDVNFALYKYHMNIINPAFTGSQEGTFINSSFRSQWAGVADAPRIQAVSLGVPSVEKRLNYGALFYNDKTFVEQLSRFYANFSYKLRLQPEMDLYLGLSFGGQNFALNFDSLQNVNPIGDQFLSSYSRFTPNVGVGASLTSAGVWTNASSILFKTNFIDLDNEWILNKINSISVKKWDYKNTNETHIGPTSEEFIVTFGVGNGADTSHLGAIDVSGVALKGVQALIEKVETLKEKVEGLKIENSNYQNKLQKQELLLQQLMTRLEALENQ